MSRELSEWVGEISVGEETFDIYEYYDSSTFKTLWYDVFDDVGNCINDGSPFYDMPTKEMIKLFLN